MENIELKYYEFTENDDSEESKRFMKENNGIYNIRNEFLVLNSNGNFYVIKDKTGKYSDFASVALRGVVRIDDLKYTGVKRFTDKYFEEYWCSHTKCLNCPIISKFTICPLEKLSDIRYGVDNYEIYEIKGEDEKWK